MTAKQRRMRGEFLMNWFLEVFNGVKAPYRRRNFKGIAHQMETLLASGGQYKAKYQKQQKASVGKTLKKWASV